MEQRTWTYIFVGVSFAVYIGIAIWSKAKSAKEFYIAGGGVSPLANGLATAADWMSAASFMGMAGLIASQGYGGSVFLMGWTGGYVLLALCLAPYLRKFGKFTVPDFVGARYYSNTARVVALVCAIFISFTYVAGQMRGVGVVFSRFLEVDINLGVFIGMGIVFFYAVLGGMKGITYTQVAQYCVLIFAFTVPAIFIAFNLTGNYIPQLALGMNLTGEEVNVIEKLDQIHKDLGFPKYSEPNEFTGTQTFNMFLYTLALMVGTAGLPHVIIRFFTVPRVKDARISAGYALFFIAILYTTAPAVAAFARLNMINKVNGKDLAGKEYATLNADGTYQWFYDWEKTGLLGWVDKNGDGKMQYVGGDGKHLPVVKGKWKVKKEGDKIVRGKHGQVVPSNEVTDNANEIFIDRDIIVLANPEIANLPKWVIALVAAGGLAAALSTAAGLLLVISTSISHDLIKKVLKPDISDKQELLYARSAAVVAVCIAGWFGINPPGFVAEVVGFAFGFAASSFFPVIIMGIFSKRMNKEGAIAG
ncbi:MAG: cation acetate symporter, partial [Lentisphaeria bacterium]|nr:cation acetate symporter [Lentisphaeria bacterium]